MSTFHYGEITPVGGIITPELITDELGANGVAGRLELLTNGLKLNSDGAEQEVGARSGDGTAKITIKGDGNNTLTQFVEQINTPSATGSKVEVEVNNDTGGSVAALSVEMALTGATAMLVKPYFSLQNGGSEKLAISSTNLCNFVRTTGNIKYPNRGFIQTFFMLNLANNVYMVRESTANTPSPIGYLAGDSIITRYALAVRNPAASGIFGFFVERAQFGGPFISQFNLQFDYASPTFTFTDAESIPYSCFYGTFSPALDFGGSLIAVRNDTAPTPITGTLMLFGLSVGLS